jgi:hypothetical protein
MAKYTEKWKKDFTKRYSKTISELQSLENEYKQMVLDNPSSWISVYPDESNVEFGKCDGFYVSHYKEDASEDYPKEHISVSLKSEVGMFSFALDTFDQIKEFRNDVIEAMDKFNRPNEEKNLITDDCEEEDEDWENNEEQEYTIQASRTCVQTWTHTVMARSTCEAYRLVQEDPDGSTHDENDDYDQYGEIDYESI